MSTCIPASGICFPFYFCGFRPWPGLSRRTLFHAIALLVEHLRLARALPPQQPVNPLYAWQKMRIFVASEHEHDGTVVAGQRCTASVTGRCALRETRNSQKSQSDNVPATSCLSCSGKHCLLNSLPRPRTGGLRRAESPLGEPCYLFGPRSSQPILCSQSLAQTYVAQLGWGIICRIAAQDPSSDPLAKSLR